VRPGEVGRGREKGWRSIGDGRGGRSGVAEEDRGRRKEERYARVKEGGREERGRVEAEGEEEG